MRSNSIILILVFGILCGIRSYAQEVKLEPIIVTGTKIPQEFNKLPRKITIIDSAQIERIKPGSLNEFLNLIAGADMQERGQNGIQADITMRGSTFQQVLVLVDGVRVSDPQTSHNIMSLPITLGSVEKVEVLHGQGSSLYGPDAFAGAVNIITKKPKNAAEAKLNYGSYGTWDGSVSFGRKYKALGGYFSVEGKKSDGFSYDRDFNVFNLYLNSSLDLDWGEVGFTYGFSNKEFGAYDFYSPFMNKPSREWTKTDLVNVQFTTDIKGIILQNKTYSRSHEDTFMYDLRTPNLFVNHHVNRLCGNDFQIRLKNLVLGNEVIVESIKSSNIGDHLNYRVGLYGEYSCIPLGFFNFNIGLRGDYHSVYGFEWAPSLNASYRILSNLRLYSSIGRAFRAPSFTELYYTSPSSKGDPDLKAETNWSYEAGLNWTPKNWVSASLAFFLRDEANAIDWVKGDQPGNSQTYFAQNIGQLVMRGIEAEANFLLKPVNLSLGYSYINSQSTTSQSYISKYALRYPEHQATIKITHPLLLGINQSWAGIFKQRPAEAGYFLLSSAIFRKIGNIDIFVKGTNLLNTQYQEVLGVAGPGTWIWSGLNWGI